MPMIVQESIFAEYAGVLRRHRIIIGASALAGLLCALLSTVTTRPLYRTRTSIDVQSINGNFMQLNEVSRVGSESSDTAQQTQIKILESDALSERTVLSLLQESHPQRVQSMEGVARLLRTLHLSAGPSLSYEATVRDAAHRLKVKPLGVTRLIEMDCESWDPSVAQAFCNRIVREYRNQDVETRSEEAQSTSTFLSRQLADIKEKAMDSQRKLEAAVGNNGLMLSQETNSTGEERLRELQNELVRAEADRMQRESDASVARTATADTLPNVLDNPIYRAYQAQIADLQSKLSALVPTLTEANPRVIRLRAQIAEAQAGLAAARSTSSGRQNNELAAARHREGLLQVAYNAQMANVSSDLQKSLPGKPVAPRGRIGAAALPDHAAARQRGRLCPGHAVLHGSRDRCSVPATCSRLPKAPLGDRCRSQPWRLFCSSLLPGARPLTARPAVARSNSPAS